MERRSLNHIGCHQVSVSTPPTKSLWRTISHGSWEVLTSTHMRYQKSTSTNVSHGISLVCQELLISSSNFYSGQSVSKFLQFKSKSLQLILHPLRSALLREFLSITCHNYKSCENISCNRRMQSLIYSHTSHSDPDENYVQFGGLLACREIDYRRERVVLLQSEGSQVPYRDANQPCHWSGILEGHRERQGRGVFSTDFPSCGHEEDISFLPRTCSQGRENQLDYARVSLRGSWRLNTVV